MNNDKIIILGDHLPSNKRILSGRDVGEKARDRYKLSEFDDLDGVVTIVIPKKIWTLSASFFLGCFGNSVRKLGEEKFRQKYIFDCDELFRPNIDDGIYRALNTTGDL